MEASLEFDNKLWINKLLLKELFSIPIKSIDNRLAEMSETNWESISKDNHEFINYDSIPTNSRNKYLLPNMEEAKEILAIHQASKIEGRTNKKRTEYRLMLENGVKNFSRNISLFIQVGNDIREIHSSAKKYAFLITAIGIVKRDGRNSKKNIIHVTIGSNILSDLQIPNKTKELYRYLKGAEKANENGELVKYCRHGLSGRPSNNRKINQKVESLIVFLARNGNNLKTVTITHQLNVLLTIYPRFNGSKLLSSRAVSDFLNKPLIKNVVRCASNPESISEIEPQVYSMPTDASLRRVYIDGTKIQFVHKNSPSNTIGYQTIIVMMDSFSSKILGFSISKTENAPSLMKAIRNMLHSTNYVFPEEIVTDKGSAMRSNALKKLIKKIETLGLNHSEVDYTKVEHILTSNPRSKASVERFFRSFQDTYLRPIFGFIGEGIKAKSRRAHPNKTIIAALNNPDLLNDQHQFNDLITMQIIAYNKYGFDLNSIDGPNDLYKKGLIPGVGIRVSSDLLPYLCFPSNRATFRNCSIRIFNESNEYIFQEINSNLALKYNGEPLDYYIDYENPNEIHMYEADSPKYIFSMKRISRIPQSKKLMNADAQRLFRKIMNGKKEVKKHFDDLLENNFQEVVNAFSESLPSQIVSFTTHAKDAIYLMEFLEELNDPTPTKQSEILYNINKSRRDQREKKKEYQFDQSTF